MIQDQQLYVANTKEYSLGNLIYLPLCCQGDVIYCPLVSHTQSLLMCGFMRGIVLRVGHLKMRFSYTFRVSFPLFPFYHNKQHL